MSRTRSTSRILLGLWIVSALVSACDREPHVRLDAEVDATTPPPDGGSDAGTDAPMDREAPTVVSTMPADDAVDVPSDATIVVRFSERMADAGAIVLVGAASSDELTWNAARDEVSWTPPALPEGLVDARLEGFADVAGNAMFPYSFSFTVVSSAPVVVSTSPAEGATDVSGRVGAITIELSRPMDVTAGTVSVIEGGATITGTRWTSSRTLEVGLAPLAYETTHRFALEGFVDRRGTALDADVYLGDGHLDFTTGADTDAPQVVDATPFEGALDVDDGATTEIVIGFDEAMATVGTATLQVEGTETVLDATWDDDRTLSLDTIGLLRTNAEHRVVLEGFTDVAGNALDGVAVLGDGALDFVTGRDVSEPFVRISDPVEGSDNVGWRRDTIRLDFSEAMDTSVSEIAIDDGTAPFTATGTWSMGGSVLTLDVAGRLAADTSYRVDLRALTDVGGTPLDDTHAYLGDGALDFTGDEPTGENCRDAATVAQATTTDGVHTWVFPEASIAFNDGGASTCAVNNTPPADGVIRYTKTTGDLASGGTALRIRAQGTGDLIQNRLTVQVFAAVCDPTTALATMGAELKCVSGREVQEQYLDLPAGDYFVWFSSGGSTTPFFYGATIELEEVAAVPEGESCANPLDRTSATYTAPSAPGEPESWTLAMGSMTGYDVGVAAGRDELACDPRTGPDAVIEVVKASDTSVLRIFAEGDEENTTSMDFSLDLRTSCGGDATTSVLCENGIAPRGSEGRYFRGPAGTYYLWVAEEFYSIDFPSVRVSVQEIEPTTGESCATAIPVTVGTSNAIDPSSTRTVDHPSCADAGAALSWYRFTTTSRHTRLRTDAGSLVATRLATTERELDCRTGDLTRDATVFSPVGVEVCVAVASDAPVTSLTLDAEAYEGVVGTPTVLPYTLPINPTNGETLNPSTVYWTALTPTTMYSNNVQIGVISGPLAGGAMEYLLDAGFEELGYAAVAVGEQLFLLEEQGRTGDTARVRRLIDDTGRVNLIDWDTGSSYITDDLDTDAMTYDGANLIVVARPTSTLSATTFFRLSATAPEAAVPLGSAAIRYVNAIAANATHFYVIGSGLTTGDPFGLYRIARADFGGAMPAPATLVWSAASVDVTLNGTSGSYDGMVLQRVAGRDYVYVRDDSNGDVTVTDVSAVPPRFLGVIGGRATSGNNAIGLSADGTFLVVSNTTTDTWTRLD
jgi:hypothetical protein